MNTNQDCTSQLQGTSKSANQHYQFLDQFRLSQKGNPNNLRGGKKPPKHKKNYSPVTVSNAKGPAGLSSIAFSCRGIPQVPSQPSAPLRFGAHGERNGQANARRRQDPSLQKMEPTEQGEKSSPSCCSTA